MSKNNKPRVLIDLALGHQSMGFSGIPQDTRLLFSGLTKSDKIEPVGMIWALQNVWNSSKRIHKLEDQSVFMGPYLNGDPIDHNGFRKIMRHIMPSVAKYLERRRSEKRTRYKLEALNPALPKELVWRHFFMSTIEPKNRVRITNKDYVLTDLSVLRANRHGLKRFLKPLKLDTKEYDFILFQDSRKIKPSPNTKRIIRYHDAIPVLQSDTTVMEWFIRVHYRSLKAVEKDSIFICNSPSSLEELRLISPKAAEKARIIPYFIPKMEPLETTRQQLYDMARLRFSPATTPSDRPYYFEKTKKERIDKWFDAAQDEKSIPKYIMTLCTIEPRKNILGLISAWQRLLETHPNLRLLIVGKAGWNFEKTLEAMKPFVESGQLLHLEKAAQRELRYLYSAAQCFVFPSFAEGFGLPPVEAMQCNCPVVVSDIPAHRYMGGDAALYCDPYDRADITGKINQILTTNVAEELRPLGRKNAERFSEEAVLPLWEKLFEEEMQG